MQLARFDVCICFLFLRLCALFVQSLGRKVNGECSMVVRGTLQVPGEAAAAGSGPVG